MERFLTELSVKELYSLSRLPSSVGTVPVKELSLSSKYATSFVSCPSSVGTVPIKELFANVKRVTETMVPSSVGMVPVTPCSLKSITVARGEYCIRDESCMP